MTVTTATAASLASVSVRTIRTWCRTGLIVARKLHGRWTVTLASLLHRLNAARPRALDRLRKGENAPAMTGRAARVRVGHYMSMARRHAVLDALCDRANGDRTTAAKYLRTALDATEPFIGRYDSPFGASVATAYRALFGAEPQRGGLARVGVRLFTDVFTYRPFELAALQAGALAYSRTADLVM
jgi:hypothetical protein